MNLSMLEHTGMEYLTIPVYCFILKYIGLKYKHTFTLIKYNAMVCGIFGTYGE